MFKFVFLFVVFGAFLEASGATKFVVDFAEKVFGKRPGGAAKVAVLGSGLMGSLSGSAVANAVTTGSFTIPMMKSNGFKPHIAGGITAAAATGGALVPPIMGAGAYMMLEIVPDVTLVQIIKAALIPAILYYLSILLIVHFYAHRIGSTSIISDEIKSGGFFTMEAVTFFGALAVLMGFLLNHVSAFRSVSYSLAYILVLTILNPRVVTGGNRYMTLLIVPVVTCSIKFGLSAISGESVSWSNAGIFSIIFILLLGMTQTAWRSLILNALVKSAKNGIPLISASACVGIIMGIVLLTGVGTKFINEILPLARESLFLALVAIMCCSIILGM